MSGILRSALHVALFLFVISPGAALFAQAGAVMGVAPPRQKEPATPPSSVLAGQTLYVSAQAGYNSDSSLPTDFRLEVSRGLEGVRQVLRGEGLAFPDLTSITVYLKDPARIEPLNEVYWRTIGSDPPARTILIVGNLPNGTNIQISAVAVKGAHRKVVRLPGWPSGQHTDPAGILADDVLYLSAQSGVDQVTQKLPADFGGEVKQALENVKSVLNAVKMSMANVVWVNPYLSSTGSQERTMNKVYATYFEVGSAPGRGTFTVVDLPNHSHIVFTCVAGADLSKRKAIRPRNERPSPTASPGVMYGDTLYLSAKDAYVPALGIISPALDIQTRLSMRNLLDGLQEADMDFSNVVSSTIYLRDIKDAGLVDTLYRSFFKQRLPAQTVLQQNLDVNDIDTEQISLIAVRSPVH